MFPQSVMVCVLVSPAGVGPLCFLMSKEVLEHFMLPAADQLYGDADFIFQQDLSPAYSANGLRTMVSLLIGQLTHLTLTL